MHDPITAAAINKLIKTVAQFSDESSKYSKRMLYLTWVVAALTFVMAVLVFVQIYMTFWVQSGSAEC